MDPKEIHELLDEIKRRAELINGLIDEFDFSLKKNNLENFEEFRRRYLSGETPTWELNLVGSMRDVYKLVNLPTSKYTRIYRTPVFSDTEELLDLLSGFLIKYLNDMGYRDGSAILTHQEHSLIFSSGVLGRYGMDNPYTVSGILDRRFSVEEVRTARELERFLYIRKIGSEQWGFESSEYYMLLPEIDNEGVTLHDPYLVDLVDPSTGEYVLVADKLVEGAPYRR